MLIRMLGIGLAFLYAVPANAGIVVTWGAPIPEERRITTYTPGGEQDENGVGEPADDDSVGSKVMIEQQELDALISALFLAAFSSNPDSPEPDSPEPDELDLEAPAPIPGSSEIVGDVEGAPKGGCSAAPMSLWALLAPLGLWLKRRRS